MEMINTPEVDQGDRQLTRQFKIIKSTQQKLKVQYMRSFNGLVIHYARELKN